MSSIVTLLINDIAYSGWKSVSISRSIEAISGSFKLAVTNRTSNSLSALNIKTNDACELYIDNDIVITGYVDNVEISASATDHVINISGRDKTKDIVDCSVINCPSEFKNDTLMNIVSKIAAPYNVSVKSNVGKSVVEKFAIQPGERCFEAIDRLCGSHAVLATSTPDGNILLTRSSENYADDDLIWFKNIISANAKYSSSDRYNKYTVIGHRPGTDESDVSADAQIKAFATDPTVKTNRELIIIANKIASVDLAQRRALWEAAVRAGRSATVDITVRGWRQSSGALWMPNLLVDVSIPPLQVEYHTMLIGDITFNFGLDSGFITQMSLKRADAYLPEPLPEKTTKVKVDPWASVRAATKSKL
jgi:prophage tail gpP-like protein